MEKSIKQAYALKCLDAQVAEKHAYNESQKLEIRKEDQVRQECFDRTTEKMERECREKKARAGQELGEGLRKQIADKARDREEVKVEEHRERQALIAVDEFGVASDRLRDFKKREEEAEDAIAEHLVVQEFKEIQHQNEHVRDVQEDLKNDQYLQEVRERDRHFEELNEDRRREREHALTKVADLLMEEDRDIHARRAIMIDLMVADVRRDVELKRKELEMSQNSSVQKQRQAWQEQIEFEEKCKEQFMKREREYAEDLMRQLIKSQKHEQATELKKRRMRTEYREELDRLMAERERIRDEELAKLRMQTAEAKEEFQAAEALEQQRGKALLAEHIGNIGTYMDARTLIDQAQ